MAKRRFWVFHSMISSKASVGNMQTRKSVDRESPRQENSSSRNKKMLRLLILFLILQGSAATSKDTEGNSSGFFGDDEDGDGFSEDVISKEIAVIAESESFGANPGLDKSTGDEDAAGGTLVIIIAAVSIAVLAIGSIVAIVLFRRYLQRREQGVYSVPAEQGQKAAV